MCSESARWAPGGPVLIKFNFFPVNGNGSVAGSGLAGRTASAGLFPTTELEKTS